MHANVRKSAPRYFHIGIACTRDRHDGFRHSNPYLIDKTCYSNHSTGNNSQNLKINNFDCHQANTVLSTSATLPSITAIFPTHSLHLDSPRLTSPSLFCSSLSTSDVLT